MHCLDDFEGAGVAQIIRRHVVALEWRNVAITAWRRIWIAQPRIIVAVEVPEMLVRIDNREVFRFLVGNHKRDACVLVIGGPSPSKTVVNALTPAKAGHQSGHSAAARAGVACA